MEQEISYSVETANAHLYVKAEFKIPQANPRTSLRKELRELNRQLVVKAPSSKKESLTFDDPSVGEVLKKVQIFPKEWTCYQPITDWKLHPLDKEIRKYLQYIPDIKLLQEWGPVYNVVDRPIPNIAPKIGQAPNGFPDESYFHDFITAKEYAGPRPIPDNLCVKIDEAYFYIPEKQVPPAGGPWIYKGVPEQSVLEQYQRGQIGTNMDRHAIVVDIPGNTLWEYYKIFRYEDMWYCGYAVKWDLNTIPEEQRDPTVNATYGHNSCDAAGLPIFPLLLKKEELESGEINHAIRCTIQGDMIARDWVSPAVHQAGYSHVPSAPRYGERFRLREDIDISKMSKHGQTICRALKKYGMIVADGGISVRLSCAPNVPQLHGDLWELNFNHFEVVVKE